MGVHQTSPVHSSNTTTEQPILALRYTPVIHAEASLPRTKLSRLRAGTVGLCALVPAAQGDNSFKPRFSHSNLAPPFTPTHHTHRLSPVRSIRRHFFNPRAFRTLLHHPHRSSTSPIRSTACCNRRKPNQMAGLGEHITCVGGASGVERRVRAGAASRSVHMASVRSTVAWLAIFTLPLSLTARLNYSVLCLLSSHLVSRPQSLSF